MWFFSIGGLQELLVFLLPGKYGERCRSRSPLAQRQDVVGNNLTVTSGITVLTCYSVENIFSSALVDEIRDVSL